MFSTRAVSCVAALACALLTAPAFAEPSVFPTAGEKKMAEMLEPVTVSAAARKLLKSKMKGHSKDMRDLVMAVATLKYDKVKKHAQILANEPRLDPAAGSAAGLPEGFFTLQDGLKKTAQELVTAAEASDSSAVRGKFGEAINTCMACHAGFLVPQKSAASPK